jgi:hypothetical protein
MSRHEPQNQKHYDFIHGAGCQESMRRVNLYVPVLKEYKLANRTPMNRMDNCGVGILAM